MRHQTTVPIIIDPVFKRQGDKSWYAFFPTEEVKLNEAEYLFVLQSLGEFWKVGTVIWPITPELCESLAIIEPTGWVKAFAELKIS